MHRRNAPEGHRGLRRIAAACAAACLAALLGAAAPARATAPESPRGFAGWPRALIEIHTRNGPRRLNVTVADTPERQEQGLMFVRTLDADEGMWFPQHPPRVMQMWMRNTLIPLDMLFVDGRGRIACIAAHTTPQSLAIIGCHIAVSGVLEIAGGHAQRSGITVGSRIDLRAYRAP